MSRHIRFLVTGLVIGLLLGAGGLDRCGDTQRRQLRASADSLRGAVIVLRARALDRDRRDRATQDSLGQQLRLARYGNRGNEYRVDTLLQTVATLIPDSLGDSLQTLIGRERDSYRHAEAIADSLIVALRGSVAYWRDTAFVEQGRQLDRSHALLAAALRLRGKRLTCGPAATVGYGIRGADAVAGVGCVLRLW